MEFVQIQFGSKLYEQEIELRNRLLREPLGLDLLADDLNEERGHLHFGVLDNDTLIACCVAIPLTRRDAKLRQMAVAEDRQRSGVGTYLMEHTELALYSMDFDEAELNARDVAVGFYEKLGYAVEGDEFIEVTIPHYRMTKTICNRPSLSEG